MLSITRTVLDTMAVEAAQTGETTEMIDPKRRLIDAFSSSKSQVERGILGILACRE